jgi:hypothetical protein
MNVRQRTRMPWWAWVMPAVGLLMLLLSAADWPGSLDPARDIAMNIGSALLLAYPIFLAERGLEKALRGQLTREAAVRRARELTEMHEVSQFTGREVRVEDVQLLLVSDSWCNAGVDQHDKYSIWEKNGEHVAFPKGGNSTVPGYLEGALAANVIHGATGRSYWNYLNWVNQRRGIAGRSAMPAVRPASDGSR